MVRKDQLPYKRSLCNWVVYLKITLRERLFFGKLENGDRITPSNSQRARGTKQKIGKERVIQKCELHKRNPCARRLE